MEFVQISSVKNKIMCNCKQEEYELLPELEVILNKDQQGLFPEKNWRGQNLPRLMQWEYEFEGPAVENIETKYQDILSKIQVELNRRFRTATDPGLNDRRNKLLVLFSSVPPTYSKSLYDKLQSASAPLGKLFRYKLKTATRNELLSILRMRMTIPTSDIIIPPQQGKTQDLWHIVKDIISKNIPLPASLNQEFEKAANRFISILQLQNKFSHQLSIDRVKSLICILYKLLKPGTDDAVILWCKIRPTKSRFNSPETDICSPIDENLLYRYIKSKDDVLKANEQLRFKDPFIEHLKVSFLDIQAVNPESGDEGRILMLLGEVDHQIKRTTQQLAIMANPELGGLDMPVYYLAIKDWIAEKQRNPRSVYSC